MYLLGCYSSGEYEGDVRLGCFNVVNDDEFVEKIVVDIINEYLFELIVCLCIGGVDYMIGEIFLMDMLVFYQMDDLIGEWKNLYNIVEEGWLQVVVEIIVQICDIICEYIWMYMIYCCNVNVGDNICLFDLYGFEWYL